jgi:phosphogluconate dehydratase
MELSLFSRDVIALSTAVALSHQMFDAAVYLGVCDKIVPGLIIGALSFGHLPAVFIPAGPMTSGLPNDDKAKIRQLYAEGKVDRTALLEAEAQLLDSYLAARSAVSQRLNLDFIANHSFESAIQKLVQRHAE